MNKTEQAPQPKILHLTLKKKWFDMIWDDIKFEEYREIKWYWVNRFFEMIKPLKIEKSAILYTKLTGAYHFSVGLMGSRRKAIEFLLSEGVIKYKHFDEVSAKNGYSKDAPEIGWKHGGITIGSAKPEWSDGNTPTDVFILKIVD